ncbi:MAG: aspartate/glutamate racemase family protein [Burkholderiaceae bacterium]|jgi:allantoin racemase|nr:aspartate/glutamate racemase family protein [Betaproteobacteria bacterium]MDC1457459.1 aspartate/glutamate racemase family protein [Burkholderiaceae bacterium]MCH9846178.1 aspartate/glutamate racemase family protein [Betaproteobacteria bacterium]MDG1383753.1 aspartate/glutamate racemase family protein [Burkholderiaceae bacterium]MDO7553108.1 aspartate/glutamate racemase family protein [Burkholderiaceae bacterium]|tara:strand:+ start:1407 stop:2138 length:732 start_codon:yes stop_codon:yes gene_type:complete
MRILVVNPNTTVAMTRKIADAARQIASPGTEIMAITSPFGPASIEGYFDEATSLNGLLQAIHRAENYDAVVIACFDDTGLDAARCLTDKPVIGIGEAAYRCAAMVSNKFSVVTTLARSVPALEHNLARYGMAHQCVKVRSSEVAVLDLEDNNPAACRKIEAEIEAAIADDKAEAIVLGCAGMADLADSLSQRYQLPVLDGLACAVALAESLVRLKLRTSRLGGYASPPAHKLQLAFGSDPVAA